MSISLISGFAVGIGWPWLIEIIDRILLSGFLEKTKIRIT